MGKLRLKNRGFIIPSMYDQTVGRGVTFDGYANLPLRNGAKRFWVNSVGGSNGTITAAQSSSTPMATIQAAQNFITDSEGDHIMVAEGATYNEAITGWNGRRGFNQQYPTVIQSYDPNDPTNFSKWGRPAPLNRPIINNTSYSWGGGGGQYPHQPGQFIAVRGLYFQGNNADTASISFVPPASLNNGYILYENNIFDSIFVTFEQGSNSDISGGHPGGPFIFRGNSSFGQWQSVGHSQGMFISGCSLVVVEDNFFWHNGWKIGVSRDANITLGGLTGDEVFRHILYIGEENKYLINRRNGFVDGPADAGQQRCPNLCYRNLYIDNPMSITAGGGLESQITHPLGTKLQFLYNTILGDADITSTFPRGQAFTVANGTTDSLTAYNLIARSRGGTTSGATPFTNSTQYNMPSYMTWDHNTIYQWCPPGNEVWDNAAAGDVRASYIHNTVTNNRWDGTASGSNVNNTTITYSNPYTADQLYTAMGYTGATTSDKKQAFVDDCKAHPENRKWMQGVSLLQSGYNIDTSSMPQ